MSKEITVHSINLPLSESLSVESVRSDRVRFPHFCDAPEKVRCAWLYDEISYLYALRHQSPVAQFITIDSAVMNQEIMKNKIYKDLTFYEISQAFRNGVNGFYGELYGLTCNSLISMIDSYIRDQIPTYKRMRERRIGNDDYKVTAEMKNSVLKCYEAMMKQQ